jgi:hypothetical protein
VKQSPHEFLDQSWKGHDFTTTYYRTNELGEATSFKSSRIEILL